MLQLVLLNINASCIALSYTYTYYINIAGEQRNCFGNYNCSVGAELEQMLNIIGMKPFKYIFKVTGL